MQFCPSHSWSVLKWLNGLSCFYNGVYPLQDVVKGLGTNTIPPKVSELPCKPVLYSGILNFGLCRLPGSFVTPALTTHG